LAHTASPGGESSRSVIGDLGYIVTFRQVDPLFAIDS
jgi:uncharacterized secreted protein with C-terminal beta-propeller domain